MKWNESKVQLEKFSVTQRWKLSWISESADLRLVKIKLSNCRTKTSLWWNCSLLRHEDAVSRVERCHISQECSRCEKSVWGMNNTAAASEGTRPPLLPLFCLGWRFLLPNQEQVAAGWWLRPHGVWIKQSLFTLRFTDLTRIWRFFPTKAFPNPGAEAFGSVRLITDVFILLLQKLRNFFWLWNLK